MSLNAVAVGYAFAADERDEILISVLQLLFTLYTLGLTAKSVLQTDVPTHFNDVIHLTSLTTVASLLLASAAVLPDSPPPRLPTSPSLLTTLLRFASDDTALLAISYLLVLLYSGTCFISFTTPLGPPLYYPPLNIYSEKQVKLITNNDPENVCGIVGASPWDTLMFSYTTKVVWLGYVAQTLEIGDLPIVPSNMRASANYSAMRKAGRKYKLRMFKPRIGSGWALAYRLLRLNSMEFLAEFLLATVSAVLFYAPALFLKQFISYLEADTGREHKDWGWVWVLGIFMSNAIGFLSALRSFLYQIDFSDTS